MRRFYVPPGTVSGGMVSVPDALARRPTLRAETAALAAVAAVRYGAGELGS